MQNNDDVIYRLNERDEIVYANSAYDAFANANKSVHVESTAVLNRSLWGFISDPTTQQLYREAIRRARSGYPVRFRFRCDSPECRRLMEITVALDLAGSVEFRVHTVTQEPRSPQPLLDANATHSQALLRVCSWCKKVYANNAWMEIEEAVSRLRLFEQAEQPTITHGICDQCYQDAVARLKV